MARRSYLVDQYGRRRRRISERTVPENIRGRAIARCRELAAELVAEIKRQAPRRQPQYVEPGEPGGLLEAGYDEVDIPEGAAIVNPVRYWQFVEFGTAEHGDAQPHVRTAIEAVRARHKGRRR